MGIGEVLLMSTHNICFHTGLRKILIVFSCKKCLIWSYDFIGKCISRYLSYPELLID